MMAALGHRPPSDAVKLVLVSAALWPKTSTNCASARADDDCQPSGSAHVICSTFKHDEYNREPQAGSREPQKFLLALPAPGSRFPAS